MLSMQSRTKKSTLVLLGCLALAGLASCSGGGSSGSRDDDMKIYPPPENRAPVAVGSILDQTVAVGGTRTWNTQELEPYFRDPDGDTLTYTFEFVSGASLLRVISDGSGNELLAVRGLAAGTATVRVTASDPRGLTAQQDLGIRVEAVAQNRAPEAVGSIPDQTVAVGGTKTWDVVRDLQPYFRDPDGDALTYTFQFAHYSGVLSDPTKSGSEVMVRGLAAGTSTVRVTASDGELSAVQRFTLRVEAEERNRAPEAVGSIPDQTVAVGGTRTWNAQELEPYFRDPDGDTLTYTFEFVSGASLLRVTSDGSGNELLAVRGLAAGTATVRVTARDPDGLTAQQDLDIQVQVQTAIDITGRQSVEGQIDSPDDSVLYSFRIDEPSVVTFQTSSDFEITVYDSEGNVLQTSPVVEDDRGTPTPLPTVASVPGERVVPILIGFAARAAGTYLVRVALSRAAAAAARRAAAQGVRFATRRVTLATAKVAYQIRRIARFAEVEVGLADGGTVDYKSNFEGNLTGITWSITPEVRTRWGSLRLTITNEILRLSPPTGSRPACGNQRERSQRVTAQLSWSWRQLDIPLSDETPIPFLVNRDKAPRRIQAGSWEISATVPEGGSETVSLTDYIEDPDGGPLTFTPGSVPSGLGVTRDGARWTITAQEGAADGTITVTATDQDGECWNFPLQVSVGPPEVDPPACRALGLVGDETVPDGSSGTFVLTDYLRDLGDVSLLTFTLDSVPSDLRATLDGFRLTIRAQEGAAGGPITVIITNENDECVTFQLQVSVGSDGPSTDPTASCFTYSSPSPTGRRCGVPTATEYGVTLRNTCSFTIRYAYQWDNVATGSLPYLYYRFQGDYLLPLDPRFFGQTGERERSVCSVTLPEFSICVSNPSGEQEGVATVQCYDDDGRRTGDWR